MNDFQMATLGQGIAVIPASRWRRAIILVAVACLTLSLAARYTSSSVGGYSNGISVVADSAKAKTQHLLGDGVQWIAPVIAVLMLVVPRRSARIVHFAMPVSNLYLEDWL